ncbi:transglutaminase-like domain-containing protein [Mucilaginibacter sp. dw_454]|uniref:transglutaminase-like domain-containing protein n=1 Tax=Mucilaginibacter sp. dw_454 TaxID=2720079 RepID=UPI001BD6DBDC|nr:transglutaminase-like domain-containing protein [Mucilaginibacter sp. dw_454]
MKKTLFMLMAVSISLSTQAKTVTDTLTALQHTLPYRADGTQNFPNFTYQKADDLPLTHLREKYHLDSVAGNGSDVERVIRLLAWFHKQVPHNDVGPLPELNAENIIDTYRAKHYAQGCYGLAIATNEIMLSMGYSSRVVICFSNKYPEPQGGHVINTVFIPSLNKWVYIDPQENAYLKDEKGNLLSIAEVRERLVKRQPIILNPTANYHDIPTKKEEYLDKFMGEHLYRMICPLNSEYNSQTRDGRKIEYVELLPYGSVEPPFTFIETQQSAKQKIVCYHTSNADLFWKKP